MKSSLSTQRRHPWLDMSTQRRQCQAGRIYFCGRILWRGVYFCTQYCWERCVLLYTVFFFLIEVGTCARRSGGQTSGGTGGRTRFSVPEAAPGTYAVKRPGASDHRQDSLAVAPRDSSASTLTGSAHEGCRLIGDVGSASPRVLPSSCRMRLELSRAAAASWRQDAPACRAATRASWWACWTSARWCAACSTRVSRSWGPWSRGPRARSSGDSASEVASVVSSRVLSTAARSRSRTIASTWKRGREGRQ